MLRYHWAFCAPCDHYTYLMEGSRGTNKAHRKDGILLGIKCSRCKRKRAITGCFVTSVKSNDHQQTH